MTPSIGSPPDFQVRQAQPSDLPALIAFEITIARISFPDDAITDPSTHEKRLKRALRDEPAGMFVLDTAGSVRGWLWITINTNFLTEERYATFRSLAVDDDLHGTDAPLLLFRTALGYCRRQEVHRVTGRVHVDNAPMRVLYKTLGFRAKHLTMEMDLS
jgi:GNAT superfamily N-acetyltransferase